MEKIFTEKDLSILVCSCDKYNDVWHPFFFFLKKFWSNCPFPIYLMTNFKEYEDNNIITIKTGKDIDWSTNFLKAINEIDSKYILIFMEDYLLIEKPNTEFIKKAIDYITKNKISYLRLFPSPGPDRIIDKIDDIAIGEIVKKSEYRVSLQLSIWDKEYIKEIIRTGESAWEFEINGTERTNFKDYRLLSISRDTDYPIKYFCTAIVKGYWKKEAVKLCKDNGIQLDLKKRKIEPFYIEKKIKFINEIVNLKNKIKIKFKKIFGLNNK